MKEPALMGGRVVGIIFSSFQGEVRMETQQVVVRPDAATGARPHFDIDRGQWPSVWRWVKGS